MGSRLTLERANNKLQERPIICLGPIDGYETKSQWKCLNCSHIWNSRPHTVIIRKCGCPACNKPARVTNEILDSRLPSTIIRCEDIKGNQIRIQFKCVICDHVWKTTPNRITGKGATGCAQCSQRLPLSNEIIDKRLKAKNIPFQRIGAYVNFCTKITWRCEKNHEWEATPSNIFVCLTGCPYCYSEAGGRGRPITINGLYFRSQLEYGMYQILLDHFNEDEIEHEKRYSKDTRHTCDFYVPKLKLWIEVSNYSDAQYMKNINRKRGWIENRHESFVFIQSQSKLKDLLTEYVV